MNKEYRNCYIRASFSDLHFQNQIERTTFYCSVVELFHRTLIVTWYVIYQVYTWYILKKTAGGVTEFTDLAPAMALTALLTLNPQVSGI